MEIKEIIGLILLCVSIFSLLVVLFIISIITAKEENERKSLLNKKTKLEITLLEHQLKEINNE